MKTRITAGSAVLRLVQGDITKIPVDAIVNAANSSLSGGGGVDGAIHRAAGHELMAALDKVRPSDGCPTGSAVITPAFKLPAKWVVHAVGPRWRGGAQGEDKQLAGAYRKGLELAAGKGALSVSFPAISTGIYGYPVELAAPVAVGAVRDFLTSNKTSITEAVFVLFDAASFTVFAKALG